MSTLKCLVGFEVFSPLHSLVLQHLLHLSFDQSVSFAISVGSVAKVSPQETPAAGPVHLHRVRGYSFGR